MKTKFISLGIVIIPSLYLAYKVPVSLLFLIPYIILGVKKIWDSPYPHVMWEKMGIVEGIILLLFFYGKNTEKQHNYTSWSSASLRGVVLIVRKTRSYHRSASFVLRVWMRDCWSRKSFKARSWSCKMTDKVDHLRYHCNTWSVPSKDHNSFNNSLPIMTRS